MDGCTDRQRKQQFQLFLTKHKQKKGCLTFLLWLPSNAASNYQVTMKEIHVKATSARDRTRKNTNSNTHPFSFTHTLSRAPPTEGLFVPQSVAPQQQRPLPHFPLYQDRVHPPPKRVCLMNAPIKKRPERQRQARCVCVSVHARVCVHECSWCSGCERKGCGVERNQGCEVLVSTAGKSAERGENGERQRLRVRTCTPYFHHSIVSKNATTMSSAQIRGC